MRMRTSSRRNAALGLLIVGIIFVLFGLLFRAGIGAFLHAQATRAERLDPATAAIAAGRAPGREVLVEGVIDPRSEEQRGPLVAYVGEQPVAGADDEWRIIERVTPALVLALPDGSVQVIAGDYELDTPPVTVAEGQVRYRGFVDGATVMVIGTIVQGSEGFAIDADLLFGGTRAQYIARPAGESAAFGWVGLGFVVLGGVFLLGAGWRFLRAPRR